MTGTLRIAPAVEDLLKDLFRTARAKRLPIITLERLLAALLGQASVAAFWHAGLGQAKRAALRAELDGILAREPALLAARQRNRRGSLKKMLQSLARRCLPRAVAPLGRWLDERPHVASDVEHVLMRAILRVAPPKTVEASDLLLSILDNTAGLASEILIRHGVTRYALVCHLANVSHPMPAAATAGPPHATTARLFLRNDDFTPMAFVVDVLQTVFSKSSAEASALMQEVHHKGRVACGVFPLPVANERLRQVEDLAARQQHPLRAYLELSDQDDALMA
jgi:ATP-dependent Clp protease adapter protein ClpS